MKQIIFALIAIGFMTISCSQQEDISGKIDTAVNQKANKMVDSLKNVCDKNFDTQLQSRVAAAIKSNNQLTATPKPKVKPKNKPATKPTTQVKTTTASTPQKPRGRAGIGKGGGLLKNTPITTAKPKANTQTTTPANTTTTKPTKTVGNRPGVKNKDGGN